ncbi:MAG TPA: FCD domain-containing protein [Pseudolabrys sp.]|nr:FCD domain-containing protein [Pseudolabrys sp.]
MLRVGPDKKSDRKETLASFVYEQLRREIISVALAPGEKLHIRALCDRFDVALSPVREALSRLGAEGLLTQSDHHGFSVAAMSETDLLDLTRARVWLNELAIRKSIESGDAAWEESVVLSFHRLFRTPRFVAGEGTERTRAWEIAHRNFHTSLVSACGSQRLTRYCEQLFDSAERYRQVGRKVNNKHQNRDEEHRDLMEAVVSREADKAAGLIRAHFERTADLVRQVLGGAHLPAGQSHAPVGFKRRERGD